MLASVASPIDASKIRRAFPLRQFVSFCRCRVESKGTESTLMNLRKTTITILAMLSASLALAEDFKTINGKEYKDATVSRVELDGIVLKTKSGISKVFFTELPKEVQERFHYNPANATAFNAAAQAAIAKSNEKVQQEAAAKEKAAKAQREKVRREAQARQEEQEQQEVERARHYKASSLQKIGGGN